MLNRLINYTFCILLIVELPISSNVFGLSFMIRPCLCRKIKFVLISIAINIAKSVYYILNQWEAMDPSFTPQQWRGLNSPQPQSGYQKIEYKQKYIISNEKRLKKAGVIANERFINGDSSHKELGSNSLLNENEFEYGTMMEEYFSNQLSSHPSASNFSKANKNRLMQETGDILYVDNGNNFKLKAKSKSNRNFNYSQVNNDPDFSDKNNNNGIFQKSNEAMSTNDKSEFARQNNSKDQPKG